jgi:GNAT superfamily N-acetyltransferase
MKARRIVTGDAADIPLILPLVAEVQTLHANALPGRFAQSPDPAELEAFFRTILNDSGYLLICKEDDKPLGYLLWTVVVRPANPFRHAERMGLLDHITVTHSARRQGIGLSLINAMKEAMRAEGLTGWAVTYWNFNTASAALMAKAGATPAHIRAEGSL